VTFTKGDLKAGKECCEKATEGPWRYGPAKGITGDMGIAASGDANIIVECFAEFHAKGDVQPEQAQANADFIAHARTYYPRALAALEEAWGALLNIVQFGPGWSGPGPRDAFAKGETLLEQVGLLEPETWPGLAAEEECE